MKAIYTIFTILAFAALVFADGSSQAPGSSGSGSTPASSGTPAPTSSTTPTPTSSLAETTEVALSFVIGAIAAAVMAFF